MGYFLNQTFKFTRQHIILYEYYFAIKITPANEACPSKRQNSHFKHIFSFISSPPCKARKAPKHMNPPPTPGGRSRPTDGKRFWRPVGGRPCPAERWPPHLGSRRPEVTLRPAVSTRSADRRRLLTMEPVNRRTLDWIYSLVSLGSGGVSR